MHKHNNTESWKNGSRQVKRLWLCDGLLLSVMTASRCALRQADLQWGSNQLIQGGRNAFSSCCQPLLGCYLATLQRLLFLELHSLPLHLQSWEMDSNRQTDLHLCQTFSLFFLLDLFQFNQQRTLAFTGACFFDCQFFDLLTGRAFLGGPWEWACCAQQTPQLPQQRDSFWSRSVLTR